MNNYSKYLNISKLEEQWGFHVITVGYTKVAINQVYPDIKEHPPDHSFTWNKGRMLDGYYLVFISKGHGIFESARTEPCTLIAGTCFFLFPGVWHRYKPDLDSGWEEYWVGFKGPYPEGLMKSFFNPQIPNIYIGLNETLLMYFHELLEAVQAGAAGYSQIISGITLQILGLVNAISLHQEMENDPTARLISKAKFLLQESLENPVNIEALVKELPMGCSKFRKAFKRITGESPNQYLLNLRLNKAKYLLTTTDLNINEVAYQTGFDSVFYFSKLFKKKNGISPKSYRGNKFIWGGVHIAHSIFL
ncbi:MAG TPA: AraC family transcriptional regulator [Hanamia sp.]